MQRQPLSPQGRRDHGGACSTDKFVVSCQSVVMSTDTVFLQELSRIIEEAEIMYEDDKMWPAPDRIGELLLFAVCVSVSTLLSFCGRKRGTGG